MGSLRRLSLSSTLALLALAGTSGAQSPSVRPYLHAGVGIGRFVFECEGCGYDGTSLVPSLSLGVSLKKLPLDVGVDVLSWSRIGNSYTVLTASTTFRPKGVPLFAGAGVGLVVRQYPPVCTLCTGDLPGTPLGPRGSTTDPAVMLQLGGRIGLGGRAGLEPFMQYSRLSRASLSAAHGDHLTIGLRLDGR